MKKHKSTHCPHRVDCTIYGSCHLCAHGHQYERMASKIQVLQQELRRMKASTRQCDERTK